MFFPLSDGRNTEYFFNSISIILSGSTGSHTRHTGTAARPHAERSARVRCVYARSLASCRCVFSTFGRAGGAALLADAHVAADTPVYSKLAGEWKQLEGCAELVWMARQTPPSDESPVWFILDVNGERLGPHTSAQLKGLLAACTVSAESAVWSKLVGEWGRMCDTPTLRAVWEVR